MRNVCRISVVMILLMGWIAPAIANVHNVDNSVALIETPHSNIMVDMSCCEAESEHHETKRSNCSVDCSFLISIYFENYPVPLVSSTYHFYRKLAARPNIKLLRPPIFL